ncbi:hypothetical protein EZV62_008689 [Acer yangbiense]|uniref:HMA domain-containing protein n=1 Tax=Acer yangbiense TaxID=1000413 RepID=A0A5C7IEF1_9ROSI|nr:hypothetical protein EZV62_008689 [Acer yangbiense]
MRCKKCWSKAMKIVAAAEGEIISVAWEGEGKDKMVVVGDGVDVATLTTKLDRKLGYAKLLLVEEVKGKKEEKKEVKKEVKKEDPKSTPQCCHPYCPCKQQSYPFEEKKEVKKEVKKEEKKEVKKEEKKEDPKSTPQCCHPYCPCKQQSYPFEYRLCGPVVYGYEDPCTSTCNIM